MAEFRIKKQVGNVNQAWRSAGSNAMPKFRIHNVENKTGEILGNMAKNVAGAVDKVMALGKKLQDDADDMELVNFENLNREEMTRMADKFTFEDEASVEKASSAHRKTLSDWISSNKILSDEGKQRANLMLEKMNGLYQNSAQMRRLNFLANKTINEAKNNLDTAMAAGDFALAEKWRNQLDAYNIQWHGKPSGITPEDVKSKTAVSAYLNSSRKFGIADWRMDLEGFVSKEGNDRIKRNEDGTITLLGMKVNQKDADYLEREIRQRISKQTNDGADLLDELHARGELTQDKVEAMYKTGMISAAQYNQQKRYLEGVAVKEQKGVALGIYEELFDFDPMGKSQADMEKFEAYINDEIAAADISPEQRLELRGMVRKMFRKDTVSNTKKAVNPWSSQRGQELKKLIEDRFKSGGYAYKKDKTPAVAVDRKLQMLTAGARLLMEQNQSLPVSQIMERLDTINERMKEGELDRIFNGKNVVDPDKFGKVFDSRKMKDQVVADPFGPIVLKAESKIKGLKKEGYIDKADIVETKEYNGRLVWKLKDGRKVYADEYE